MAKKIKKLEVKDELPFLDLLSASGVTVDYTEKLKTRESKVKDVYKMLCKYRGFIKILRTEEEVSGYFSQCIKNNLAVIDTETNNSLDIHDNIMVGLCLYTPYNRPVYIPVMHKDQFDNRLEGQVDKEFLKEKLKLFMNTRNIYHNAKFDVNVIRNNYGIQLPIYWDTMIASKVLNENRFSNALKYLYSENIDPTLTTYHVTTFFTDNTHADIDKFALYSAMDSYETYKVYEWQNKELSTKSMSKLRSLLLDLEFRVTEVCADMEWRGFNFNEEYCDNYIKTETERLNQMGDKINKLLEPYKDRILGWKDIKGGRGEVPKMDPETGLVVKKKIPVEVTTRFGVKTKWEDSDEDELVPDPYAGVKMDWPVLLTSPQQVLCLLNCILEVPVVSTVIDDLKATGNEIADLIGKYRHLNHNLTSFFLPYKEICKNGKIYASFNQMGGEDKTVKTGRFSSTEPNLQQLPARQGEDGVRMLFGGSRDVDDSYEIKDNKLRLFMRDKVETQLGFVEATELNTNHILVTDEGFSKILSIEKIGEYYNLELGQNG